MKAYNAIPVTDAMREAGEEIASLLMTAQVAKCMNGLGGSKTYGEWLETEMKNKDLVIAYLNDEICSVEAIYIAMGREA